MSIFDTPGQEECSRSKISFILHFYILFSILFVNISVFLEFDHCIILEEIVFYFAFLLFHHPVSKISLVSGFLRFLYFLKH